MKAARGERILRYQDLYSRYSRLGLSKDHDRPMAIEGLQDRILRAFDAKGGYGVLDEGGNNGRRRGLLRRSLLWRRGQDAVALPRINFPQDHPFANVPSWSWMAYSGGIDYISMPFAQVDWTELRSPWSSSMPGISNGLQAETQRGKVTLVADAQDYNISLLEDGEGEIVLDRPKGSTHRATLCVVLGKQRGDAHLRDKIHYVLVICPAGTIDGDGNEVYERVGAGSLPGKCIAPEQRKVQIR